MILRRTNRSFETPTGNHTVVVDESLSLAEVNSFCASRFNQGSMISIGPNQAGPGMSLRCEYVDRECQCGGVANITGIDWFELVNADVNNHSEEAPFASISTHFDSQSLSLEFEITLEYVGFSTDGEFNFDNDDSEFHLGTAYVIDFHPFDAMTDRISEPGSCQNRVPESFASNGNFSEYWRYSRQPYLDNQLGTEQYLAYPPPSKFWTVESIADVCFENLIRYRGAFSWMDLFKCTDFDGSL